MNRQDIKIAIVGVGNCASSLIQGIEYYKEVNEDSKPVVGLMHNSLGGYLLSDIKVVAAFDVNLNKVGKDVAKAIWAQPNCTKKIADVPITGTRVNAAPVLDGIAPHMQERFPIVPEADDVDAVLECTTPNIIISYLPVGSEEATQFWAEKALTHRIAFINAIPSFISSDESWATRFKEAGVPCAGDDIKSQVGATILHRALVRLINERGQSVDSTYQLNIGGNTDFENMLGEERLKSKRESKTQAVLSALDESQKSIDVRIGPSDYVPYLKDNKVAYINIKGQQFGGIPFEIEARLSVEDSPDSAGVMVDAIRAMKLSLNRGLSGYQEWSAYFFKHPLRQHADEEARRILDAFISAN